MLPYFQSYLLYQPPSLLLMNKYAVDLENLLELLARLKEKIIEPDVTQYLRLAIHINPQVPSIFACKMLGTLISRTGLII